MKVLTDVLTCPIVTIFYSLLSTLEEVEMARQNVDHTSPSFQFLPNANLEPYDVAMKFSHSQSKVLSLYKI